MAASHVGVMIDHIILGNRTAGVVYALHLHGNGSAGGEIVGFHTAAGEGDGVVGFRHAGYRDRGLLAASVPCGVCGHGHHVRLDRVGVNVKNLFV